MVSMFPGEDPKWSAPGWQDGGVGVEIERINYGGQLRFRWSLYDGKRLVKTGMRRSHWGAELTGLLAEWKYRMDR